MNIFYIIWLAFPLLYFLIALWAFLEKRGRSVKRQNPGDFFKQGIFILVAVFISIAFDKYVLIERQDQLPDFLPLTFARVLLLPIVFLILGLVVGGSKRPSLQKDKKKLKS